MRDILTFQGQLKSAPLIQLNVMQVQMTKLTSWLITNLPSEYVARLQKALPEMIKDERSEAIAINP